MQEQDLATMAHDASKNAPPMGISPVEEVPITAEPHDPIHLDCDIVVLGGGGAGRPSGSLPFELPVGRGDVAAVVQLRQPPVRRVLSTAMPCSPPPPPF